MCGGDGGGHGEGPPCFSTLDALVVTDPASIARRKNENDYGESLLQRLLALCVLRVMRLLITVCPECDVCVECGVCAACPVCHVYFLICAARPV